MIISYSKKQSKQQYMALITEHNSEKARSRLRGRSAVLIGVEGHSRHEGQDGN